MTPPLAFLFLTRTCNLTCKHCYLSATPDLKGHISLDRLNKVLDLLAACKISDIRLTGGEPTIHPQFKAILTELNTRNLRPRLITNGIRLMNDSSPNTILDRLSGCWISVYGLTEEQHCRIGGRATKSLDSILAFAGKNTRAGLWVGISILLTEVDETTLDQFFGSARKYGVRHLRFLFSEPSGRALETNTVFPLESTIQLKAKEILIEISRRAINGDFDTVTLNNPFDLASADNKTPSYSTCLLHQRKMWSFSPEGDIYSCCFNVYKPEHFVGNVDDPKIGRLLTGSPLGAIFAPRCEGLAPQLWTKNITGAPTCPISIIPLQLQNTLP